MAAKRLEQLKPGDMVVVVEVPDPAEVDEFDRTRAYKNFTRGELCQTLFLAKIVRVPAVLSSVVSAEEEVGLVEVRKGGTERGLERKCESSDHLPQDRQKTKKKGKVERGCRSARRMGSDDEEYVEDGGSGAGADDGGKDKRKKTGGKGKKRRRGDDCGGDDDMENEQLMYLVERYRVAQGNINNTWSEAHMQRANGSWGPWQVEVSPSAIALVHPEMVGKCRFSKKTKQHLVENPNARCTWEKDSSGKVTSSVVCMQSLGGKR